MFEDIRTLFLILTVFIVLILVRIIQEWSRRTKSDHASSELAEDEIAERPQEDFAVKPRAYFGDYRDWVEQTSWSANYSPRAEIERQSRSPGQPSGQRRRPRQQNRAPKVKASASGRATPSPGGGVDYDKFVAESPLTRLGYRVGKARGLPVAERQEILRRALNDFLPNVRSSEYVASWGGPGTTLRYQRICSHLRLLIERSEGNPRMRQAVREWNSDLEWLGRTFSHFR